MKNIYELYEVTQLFRGSAIHRVTLLDMIIIMYLRKFNKPDQYVSIVHLSTKARFSDLSYCKGM